MCIAASKMLEKAYSNTSTTACLLKHKVSVAIMGHLRTLQYYYSKEAYRDFNFNPDTHHLIYYKPQKNEVQRII